MSFSVLSSGAVQLVPVEEFERKLKSGKKLTIKFGADPTSPDLHLGHAVVLMKLRQFQDAGHNVVFLIGDFTALIGDPTEKSKTRPLLTQQEIAQNTATYFEQVGKILLMDRISIRRNSEWLAELGLFQLLQLCSKVTLARLTEREDFAKRIENNQPIAVHELMYPLLQGYDSVALCADVELGGTDQTFNLLMGRLLQEHYQQEPQVVITMPLLEGTDGIQKMSKSLGNAVGLAEPSGQAFGKLMSIPDMAVLRYCMLLLHYDDVQCAQLKKELAEGTLHPMVFKKTMAHEIVSKFWSPTQADAAQQQFESIFQKKDYRTASEWCAPKDFPNPIWIVDLLKAIGVVNSSSDARRLIEAGAVAIDEQVITDFKATINWKKGTLVKAGKIHICRIC